MTKKNLARFAAACLSLTLVAAACGDDDDESLVDSVEDAAQDVEDAVGEAASDVEDAVGEAVDEVEDAAGEAIDEVEDAVGDPVGEDPGTIPEVADDVGDFATLLLAVEAAGLSETLSGDGPYTVFAPTDEAFEALLAELDVTAEDLLAREDLADILTYHVIADEVDAATAASLDGESAETVNGATISITVVDGEVVLNETATVITTDVEASNGIIHVIDAVLIPAS